KLREVISIADTVTVLRDGQTVATLDASKGEVSEPVLIKHMVGRAIDNIYPPRAHRISEDIVFEARNWSAYSQVQNRDVLKDINFNVRKGEIVGFAGLMGSGRTELALSIFGNPTNFQTRGELFMDGRKVDF